MFLTRKCSTFSVRTKVLLFHKFPVPVTDFTVSQGCRCRTFSMHSLNVTEARTKYAEKFVYRKLSSHTNNSISPKLSNEQNQPEELLEKCITGISSDIFQKNRVYKNELIRAINKIQELNISTTRQGLLLIRCCTELLPDETTTSRLNLVKQIWDVLRLINTVLSFWPSSHMMVSDDMGEGGSDLLDSSTTLQTLREVGDINQCTEVISNMKANNLPANERIFNSLILCQGKAGNVKSIQDVLIMMKSLKLNESVDTYTSIACAFAWNKKADLVLEEMAKAVGNGIQFEEVHVMEIVKTLADVQVYDIIPQVLEFLPEETLNKPSISPYMQSVTTYLVFQNHPMVALEIYKCLPLPAFGPKDDQGLHGRSLIRDCVKASMTSSVIAAITQELMSSGRNPIALNNAAEAALQLGKVPLAIDMFSRMQQLGMPIRPHYFWPILLLSSKSFGEKGIMNTLSTMVKMGVKPDYDTMMEYTLPYVSFTSPQNLMKKFLDTGLFTSDVLTPMMDTLLNSGQVRAASEICELFQGKVDIEKLLKPIIKGYLISSDVKSTIYILEDILKKPMDGNKDWPGRLLCTFMKNKIVKQDLTEFMYLVKAYKDTSLNISAGASDYCISCLPDKYSSETAEAFRNALLDITDDRLVDEGDMFTQVIPHPKHMNEQSLRAHLNELDSKGMNTRGVLRKLLQQYCRENNLAAAREIAERCEKEGVILSAGMKASIFDLHVKSEELDSAEAMLLDINKNFPNFHIDEFKVIDFATLMVKKKKINKAMELIKEQSKNRRIIGGRNVTKNCWRLLDATAAHGTHIETTQMFELLTSLRYCTPSNTLLGPLVRVHLNNSNIHEAVKQFSHLANKYKKTPLKHELLCQILTAMGERHAESLRLDNDNSSGQFDNLAIVLDATQKVHGAGDVTLSLIAALAELGYSKALRKTFLDPKVKFHPDALLRCCERFADEKKTRPLETIVECLKDVRRVNTSDIYDMILGVYQREDNYKSALELHTRMQELDIAPSQKFVRNICSLLSANMAPVPPELSALLDKQAKAVRV